MIVAGHQVTRIKISHEQEKFIKKIIARDKRAHYEAFNPLHRNCSTYISELLKKTLDLSIDCREYPWEIIYRKILALIGIYKVNSLALKIMNCLTLPVAILLFPLYGLVSWIIGTHACSDEKGREAYVATFKEQKKPIRDVVWEFFSGDIFRIPHGSKIRAWQEEVIEKYGSEEITLKQAQDLIY